MIKILFSPAEGKNNGGNEIARELLGSNNARKNIFDEYNKIIDSKNEEDIKKLFGLKKFDDCIPYINNIYNSKLMCAIERYQGVAYEYLDLKSLNSKELEYLKQNTIIFSNLYGPILGGDTIINYKVKQGNDVGNITPDKFYKERFTYQLDLYLAKDEILDLRAGYYDKFYKVTTPYVTLKFLKNGKTVSHWAKAYRGLVLRALAKNNISSLEEFKSLEIDNLSIHEIKIIKNKTEIVYNIL
jgi:cytoplasmic iron level regulating protein YaaA (DUF328/UPF0246 family)